MTTVMAWWMRMDRVKESPVTQESWGSAAKGSSSASTVASSVAAFRRPALKSAMGSMTTAMESWMRASQGCGAVRQSALGSVLRATISVRRAPYAASPVRSPLQSAVMVWITTATAASMRVTLRGIVPATRDSQGSALRAAASAKREGSGSVFKTASLVRSSATI